MSSRTYWLDLFTRKTWQEFLNSGASVTGFRESRWRTVQQIQIGDYLICYIVGLSRWIGVLEVVSEAFQDDSTIWQDEVFPCRVRVRPLVHLTFETAVPIGQLREQLSIFDHAHPNAWTGHLRGSPTRWKVSDGEIVINEIQETLHHPVLRPVPKDRTLPPPALDKDGQQVMVPEEETRAELFIEAAREPTLHTEVQWMLLKLGNDMGLDVWVARNDRSREVAGNKFTELPRFKRELPVRFDEATLRTIELIDVLWLRGNAVIAAFEIECTTSVYSGLLRMSDLIAMQPHLNIPLYLVAPEERRDKVISEVNRPTFTRLSPPMNQMCKFISIPLLRDRVTQAEPFVRRLSPEFIDDFAESCELESI